jgi:hypothetical protein
VGILSGFLECERVESHVYCTVERSLPKTNVTAGSTHHMARPRASGPSRANCVILYLHFKYICRSNDLYPLLPVTCVQVLGYFVYLELKASGPGSGSIKIRCLTPDPSPTRVLSYKST